MINLCFNLGITKLLTFKKALAAMEQEDFELAAEEFLDSKWAKQVGPTRSEDIAYMVRSGRYP
jgi:lysozyme